MYYSVHTSPPPRFQKTEFFRHPNFQQILRTILTVLPRTSEKSYFIMSLRLNNFLNRKNLAGRFQQNSTGRRRKLKKINFCYDFIRS